MISECVTQNDPAFSEDYRYGTWNEYLDNPALPEPIESAASNRNYVKRDRLDDGARDSKDFAR